MIILKYNINPLKQYHVAIIITLLSNHYFKSLSNY